MNKYAWSSIITVLAGLVVVLVASDDLNSGVRYGLGAVAVVGIAVGAYQLRRQSLR